MSGEIYEIPFPRGKCNLYCFRNCYYMVSSWNISTFIIRLLHLTSFHVYLHFHTYIHIRCNIAFQMAFSICYPSPCPFFYPALPFFTPIKPVVLVFLSLTYDFLFCHALHTDHSFSFSHLFRFPPHFSSRDIPPTFLFRKEQDFQKYQTSKA